LQPPLHKNVGSGKHWHKQFFRIHRFTGLIAGAFLLLLSLSGSILLFSDEIDEATHPEYYHVAPQSTYKPLQELQQAAAQVIPGQPYLFFLHLPQSADESLIMRAEYGPSFKRYIYLNPYTAEVLGQHTNLGKFTGWLLYLHFNLLSGKTGAQIILVVGILFIISLLTGIWIYRHAFRKVLTFKVKLEWHQRNRRWRNLHRILGVWAIVFNVLIVITGVLMEFKVINNHALPKAKLTPVNTAIAYEVLLQKAAVQIPGFKVIGIRPPRKAGDPIRFTGNAGEPAIWGPAPSSVSFNANTGEVEKVINFNNAPFNKKLDASVAPLHFGNYGGMPIKIIYCLFALSPGLLSISGFLIWYRRKYIIKHSYEK
jgi:uncharacterized iron-regulated membrane protein